MDREEKSLWSLVAGQRASLDSPLDDLLLDLADDAELRAAESLEAITTLREALRNVPATVALLPNVGAYTTHCSN